jgi:exodeoxyribonuclease V alpha subunit
VLAASREQGHCYLTEPQINTGIIELIDINLGERLKDYLDLMKQAGLLCTRRLTKDNVEIIGYYSKTLFYDETAAAAILRGMKGPVASDTNRIANWVTAYCQRKHIALSDEQAHAVNGVVQHRFSILTGGPGCGKTTTTLVIVRLLEAMNKTVLLAAPTGRAAQRMGEVIGREAKTIHRLLVWKGGEFQMNEDTKVNSRFFDC